MEFPLFVLLVFLLGVTTGIALCKLMCCGRSIWKKNIGEGEPYVTDRCANITVNEYMYALPRSGVFHVDPACQHVRNKPSAIEYRMCKHCVAGEKKKPR